MQSNQPPGWEYHSDNQAPLDPSEPSESFNGQPARQQAPAGDTAGDVVWSASEYIQHDRGSGWFLALFTGAIALSGLLYLVAKDIATSVIILVLAGIVALFARRKPSVIEYRVSADGVYIGSKHYPFNLFKSFSIIDDHGLISIFLTPLKRLMPPISMYCSLDDEAKIIEVIGSHLPQEQRGPEAVERLARRLRF